MKFLAGLMVLILLCSIGGVAWLYLEATVTVEATGTAVVEATAQPELFRTLSHQMRNDAVIGTTFRHTALDQPADYQFTVYTVRLKNNCFLTADMVEVQVTPMQGDVLQLADGSARALAARSTGDLGATILTDINMHSVRELNISYYMWGMPFTIRTTYGH